MEEAKRVKLEALAKELSEAFRSAVRDDGKKFWMLEEEAEDRWRPLVRDAHDGMMPDDFRYETIYGVAMALTECSPEEWDDVSGEIADRLGDCYNTELVRWLSSDLTRGEYVNSAAQEFGVDGQNFDIYALIGQGQYLEIQEVFWSVVGSLQRMADEEE